MALKSPGISSEEILGPKYRPGGLGALGQFNCLADVGGRSEFHQAFFSLSGDVKLGDKFMNGLRRDTLAAGERLKLFIGMRHTVAAHHGLDGLGEHFPSVIDDRGLRQACVR